MLVWFRPFISKPWEDFSFHFASGWPGGKPGLFVAPRKMEDLVGAHSGYFPSTAGSHYGHRPLKLIISTYCIRSCLELIFLFFFSNVGLVKTWLWFACISFRSWFEWRTSFALFLLLPRSSHSIMGSLWDAIRQTDPQQWFCLTLQTWKSNVICQHGKSTFISSWLDISVFFFLECSLELNLFWKWWLQSEVISPVW